MTSRRTALKSLIAASVPIPLTDPAWAAQEAKTESLKVLRYAFPVAETGFDPVQLIDLYSRVVTAHIFDGLYTYDHLARPFLIKPNTAVGMPEHSSDFRVWTIKIRPGIFFAADEAFKGKKRELVAEDYVYSCKRFFDPRWKSPTYASFSELKILGMDRLREAVTKNKQAFDYDTPVEGLRALDRYTLQFRLAQPSPRFIQMLAGGDVFGALAREVVEHYGDAIMAHPVGTGPFRLGEWRRSSKIVLERNLDYREHFFDAEPNADDTEGQALAQRFKGRRLPMIDRVEISVVEEAQPRWLSFLNGDQDLQERLPSEFIQSAVPGGKLAPSLAHRGIALSRNMAADVTMTVFNMEDPVIGGYEPHKVALRRAIGLGLDVKKEIVLVRQGQAIPAQSGIVPFTYGFDPNLRTENSEYSVPRAKALLDTYGYLDRDGDGWREDPDGNPLRLLWATQTSQIDRQYDELRQKDMKALGLRMESRPAQWPDNLKNMRAGKLMIWSVGNSASAPDSQDTFDSGATAHIGGGNLARFSHKRYDEICALTNTLPDGPERLALFREALRILAAYMPYKYYVHRIVTDLTHPWLVGYRKPPYWNQWWQYVDIEPHEHKAG